MSRSSSVIGHPTRTVAQPRVIAQVTTSSPVAHPVDLPITMTETSFWQQHNRAAW
jgi:hypothetical protein